MVVTGELPYKSRFGLGTFDQAPSQRQRAEHVGAYHLAARLDRVSVIPPRGHVCRAASQQPSSGAVSAPPDEPAPRIFHSAPIRHRRFIIWKRPRLTWPLTIDRSLRAAEIAVERSQAYQLLRLLGGVYYGWGTPIKH
jgi:hypothetical protein